MERFLNDDDCEKFVQEQMKAYLDRHEALQDYYNQFTTSLDFVDGGMGYVYKLNVRLKDNPDDIVTYEGFYDLPSNDKGELQKEFEDMVTKPDVIVKTLGNLESFTRDSAEELVLNYSTIYYEKEKDRKKQLEIKRQEARQEIMTYPLDLIVEQLVNTCVPEGKEFEFLRGLQNLSESKKIVVNNSDDKAKVKSKKK